MNYERFLNDNARRRKPSVLRELAEARFAVQKNVGPLIPLAAGFPNSDLFPVKTISFQLRDGDTLTLDEAKTKQCLQYGNSSGLNEFMEWIKKLLVKYHNPPHLQPNTVHEDGRRTKVISTSGSQDAMSKLEIIVFNVSYFPIAKLFAALVSKGDTILVEESVYHGCLAALDPYAVKFASVKSKEGGMDVDDLEKVLSKWKPEDVKDKDSDIPKLMYIIPTGSNPTGQNLFLERKKRIYSLAQKYNFLIMEDDPYFFLNFEEVSSPSFLSLDTDGRVLRLDSFSKIISAGMRLGYVSGPEAILNIVLYDMQTSGIHSNHLAQMMILGLLEKWGLDGFHRHVENVRETYKQKRDMCVRIANKHLRGLADWSFPLGGFFLWIKLRNITDSDSFLRRRVFNKGVVCAPGMAFQVVNGGVSAYIRISFSAVTEDEMDTGMCRLAEAIREEEEQNTY